MARLTQAQAELLRWIVEAGNGEVLFIEFGNAPENAVIIPGGPRRTASPTDCRELGAQGMIRHVREKLHEVTNEGRAAYEALTAPEPPERPPVGFQPDSA